MKMQDKVEFEEISGSPEIPKFNVLCLDKYSDQTSWYLLMFDNKEEPPINKILEGELFCKKICSRNFSYTSSLLLFGAGIKRFDISISNIDCVTIVIY